MFLVYSEMGKVGLLSKLLWCASLNSVKSALNWIAELVRCNLQDIFVVHLQLVLLFVVGFLVSSFPNFPCF